MEVPQHERFVRFPTALLDALLRAPLTGSQLRIFLWVIRKTIGWGQPWTPFSWCRLAKDLGLDRTAVYRSGQNLLRAKILLQYDNRIGVQADSGAWLIRSRTRHNRVNQLWLPAIDVVPQQPKLMSGNNGIVVPQQPFCCPATTLFRRAKESSKEILKKDRKRDFGEERRNADPVNGASTYGGGLRRVSFPIELSRRAIDRE